MNCRAYLEWKVVGAATNAHRLLDKSNQLFNRRSGRGFIRELGGGAKTFFAPLSLEPTVVFHDALRRHLRCEAKISVRERKFPYTLTLSSLGGDARVNVNLRLFFPDTLVVTVKGVEAELRMEALPRQQLLRSYPEIESITNAVFSFADTLEPRTPPTKRNLRSVPLIAICPRLGGTEFDQHFDEKREFYAKLLARHQTLSQSAVDQVIGKNEGHQFSDHKLLIDRQGLIALFPKPFSEMNGDARTRFVRTGNQVELALAIEAFLESLPRCLALSPGYAALLYFQIESLMRNPAVAFPRSTSAALTWQAIAREHRLPDRFGLAGQMLPPESRQRIGLLSHVAEDWTRVSLPSPSAVEKEIQRREGHNPSSIRKALIVTALPDEAKAIASGLRHLRPRRTAAGLVVTEGDYASPGQDIWKLTVLETGQGNSATSVMTGIVLPEIDPDFVFFVGIAGGRKEAALGDVVVGEKVYDYEAGKETAPGFRTRSGAGFVTRPEVRYPEAGLWSACKAFLHQANFAFGVHPKPIAAGGKVLGNSKGHSAQLITQSYGDALAVEKEGYGFLDALHALGGRYPGLVIRGISDRLDDKDAAEDHLTALTNASEFLFSFLDFLAMLDG